MGLHAELDNMHSQYRRLLANQQNTPEPKEVPQAQSVPMQPTAPPIRPSGGVNQCASGTLLFLQWQNAHLQTEVRHYQQALGAAKSEMQMLAMNFQMLEKKHALQLERAEHLELDLGFKSTCGMLPLRNNAAIGGLGMNTGIPHDFQSPAMPGSNPPGMSMTGFPRHLLSRAGAGIDPAPSMFPDAVNGADHRQK